MQSAFFESLTSYKGTKCWFLGRLRSYLVVTSCCRGGCRKHPWNFWKTLELHKTRCIHMYNTDYSLQNMMSSALLLVDTQNVVCEMYLSSLAHVWLCWFWQEHCYGQKVKVMYWQELVATLSNICCKSVRGGGRTEQGGGECSGWASRGASFVPINIWGAS